MTNAHPALTKDHVAVVIGAASGIGLAAAKEFARLGLSVVLADLEGDALARARAEVAALAEDGEADVAAIGTDASKRDEIEALERAVLQRFGRVHVLFNNAVIEGGSSLFGPQANWDNVLAVRLLAPIRAGRIFAPGIIAHSESGVIVNSITEADGADPADRVAGAGVIAFTEALRQELAATPDAKVSAHVFVATAAADTAQAVEAILAGIGRGDFLITAGQA